MPELQKIRFAFFGTSEFAVPALDVLVSNGFAPNAVITVPDKPAGRKLAMQISPVKEYFEHRQLTKASALFQPSKIDNEFIKTIADIRLDIGIVVSYGKFLPDSLMSLFKYGVINIHPSLLPKYRGPSPIQTAILNGDTKTGVTIMLIDDKMDHGPILTKREIEISSTTTYQELHDQLAKLGAQMLVVTLPQWIADQITPMPQNDTEAVFTKLLTKEDGKIDWTKTAEEIERMIRAYNPWPGTYTTLKDGKILKIKKVGIIEPNISSAGAFFKTSDEYPAIVCGSKALKLIVVQPEGKKDMSGNAYLVGHKELI